MKENPQNSGRAWRTVHQMVADRGYELSDEELKISLEDFKYKYSDADGGVEYVPSQRTPSKHMANVATVAGSWSSPPRQLTK